MEKANEKSVYELLAMTASGSSTLSDVPDIVFRAEEALPQQKRRKRRLKRHQRNLHSNHTTCDEEDLILHSPSKSHWCPYLTQSVVYCFCVAIVLSWLITLTLLLLSFHSELSQLDSSVEKVVAGSQGVPDALQKCHSLSKQLEHNQTDLATKFNSLSVQIKNFSIQISELHETISRVQASLAASPQVLDVPARLSELSNNVASFGSTLNDLTNTVNKLKEAATTRDKENGALRSNVTTLKESIETLQRKQSAPATTNDQNTKLEAKLVELATNLTKVNDTLSARLHFLHDDQVKNHVHLEDVENVNSNLSSRVTSLFQDVTALSSSLSDVTEHVTSLESNLSSRRDSVPAASDVTGGLLKKGDTISGVSSDMSSQKAGDIASIFKDEAPDHLRGDGGDTSKISMPTSAGPLELDLNLLPSGTPTSELEVASNPAAETTASSRSPRVTRNIHSEARTMNSEARK